MSNDPYTPPVSDLHDGGDNAEVHEPRVVDASRGLAWFSESFNYFKMAPGPWILICVIGFLIMLALSLIPLLGSVSNILAPVWVAGLMLGCKALDDGKDLTLNHLFAGFGDKMGPLVIEGLIVTLMMIAVVLLVGALVFAVILGDQGGFLSNFTTLGLTKILLLVAVYLVLLLPIIAASWFAPVLIVLGNKNVLDALKMSFNACMKNYLPFLVYGVVGLLLMIPVALTAGLAGLVVMPMLFASVYISYKDIFVEG